MSEEGEDVTPEQTDKIVSYSAATGNDDLDVCQSNLRVTLNSFLRKINKSIPTAWG